MIDRRMIQALVPCSRSLYFLDGARQRGIAYELMTGFEESLNGQLRKGSMNTLFSEFQKYPEMRERGL
ncbi:MAG: hypothetical protein KGY48_13420 [Wenzhouxiangellaceae bacterium]|jgi:membrane-bound lytic murein transglycosylase MltF|nr:hypothetical protein [Wenzhouxiangellaceae bacterium]MBS3824897.1 hypothetical protein [Wenzhouxiangellaceae bacterium]